MNLLPTFSVPPARGHGYLKGPLPPDRQPGQSLSEYLREVYHGCRWWKWRGAQFRSARQAAGRETCYFDGESPCGGALDVHHLHYDSLVNEADEDLELVCRLHHNQLHDWARGDRPINQAGMDEFARTELAGIRVAQVATENGDIPF